MSDVINQLATIDIAESAMTQMDMQKAMCNFRDTFKRLDDFKNIRSAHEQRDLISRLWHRSEVKDAQLNAVEVQAEFSKTIGQLMVLSICQAKRLIEQQTKLDAHQKDLNVQADETMETTKALAEQQVALKAQADKLELLMRDYFSWKGLTSHGAERLVEIATEVKATKEDLLGKFQDEVLGLNASFLRFSGKIEEQLQQSDTNVAERIASVRRDAECNRRELETALQVEGDVLRRELDQAQAIISQAIARIDESVSDQKVRLDSLEGKLQNHKLLLLTLSGKVEQGRVALEACRKQMEVQEDSQVQFEQTTLSQFKRLGWSLGLGLAVSLGLIAWVACRVKGF